MSKFFPRFAVWASIFLIPLFTLPFTANVLDFPKQLLLLALASAGFVFWFWSGISERKFEINLSPLNFLILGLLAAVFVSSVFSLYRYGSIWGWPLPVAESFAAMMGFGLLYFLIVNNFKKAELPWLIAIFGVSATIAAVYGVLQSFGIYLTPFLSYAKDNPVFNTVGSTGGFLMFLAAVLAMILPLAFAAQKKLAIPMKICAVILFGALLLFNGALTAYLPSKAGAAGYDFVLAPWIILAAGALSAVIFAVSNQQFSERNRVMKNVSFAMFFCAVLLIAFNTFAKPIVLQISENSNNFFNRQIGTEIILRHTISAEIAVETLKQSPREFFIGSGPGTFSYNYVKFKPRQIAQDELGWNLTFFAGSSEIVNRAATTGALGLLLFLAIILAWTIEGFRALTREEEEPLLPLAVFSGWLAIAVAAFFYPFNFVLASVFWFLLAATIAISSEKMFLLPLDNVKKNYAASMIFAALLTASMIFILQIAKNYYAEIAYLDAVKAFGEKNIPMAIQKLEIAADATNRLQDSYLTGLAQAYLAQAEQKIEEKTGGEDAQAALEAAVPYLQEAIRNAAQSTETANPGNSSNWAFRAQIYRQLIGIDKSFDDWALNMYEKAIQLEPLNPLLFGEVGQVYLIKNDLDKAKIAFEKAVELTPRYIDAHYYLALIADQRQDKAEAIARLEIVKQLLSVEDAASRENVQKAIDNLRRGGSISQQSPAPVLPQSSDLEVEPSTEGENNFSDDLEKVLREGEAQSSPLENLAPEE